MKDSKKLQQPMYYVGNYHTLAHSCVSDAARSGLIDSILSSFTSNGGGEKPRSAVEKASLDGGKSPFGFPSD